MNAVNAHDGINKPKSLKVSITLNGKHNSVTCPLFLSRKKLVTLEKLSIHLQAQHFGQKNINYMPRSLTAQQKTFIKNLVNEKDYNHFDDLTLEEQERLEKMNDHETIHHNTTRFINDYRMSKI